MSTVKEIEDAIAELTVQDMESIRDWLDELLEENLQVRDSYKAKIARIQAEVSSGTYSRVREPGS